jgi:ubiquinone/menaquinone biosynthesis C-methylase UbiE
MAPFYDRLCVTIGLDEHFRAKTIDLAMPTSGEAVLDVGCGTGVLTRLAAKAVGPTGICVGIDPGPRMIAIARRNASRNGSTARFELAAVENLPFADSSFDVVFMSFMLHHLPPDVREIGLREVIRVLRPGGRVVAVDVELPASDVWHHVFRLLKGLTGAFMFSSREPLAEILRGAGFEPERIVRARPPIVALVLARKARQAVGPSEIRSQAERYGELPR